MATDEKEYQRSVHNSGAYKEVDDLLNPGKREEELSLYWQVLSKLRYKLKPSYRFPARTLIGFYCALTLRSVFAKFLSGLCSHHSHKN